MKFVAEEQEQVLGRVQQADDEVDAAASLCCCSLVAYIVANQYLCNHFLCLVSGFFWGAVVW